MSRPERLSDLFLERIGERAEDVEPAEIDAALERLIGAVREAWPGLAHLEACFAEALAARLPRDGSPLEALGRLHAEDLCLATACARGEPAALAHFERRLIPDARAALLARGLSPETVEDALQALRQKLFVGGPGKIADYSGRGPLSTWVRMAAIRTALNLVRETRRDVPIEQAPLATLVMPAAPPELGFVKARYRGDFKACFEAAFAALEPRQRTLLKLQLIDGLTTTKIGRIYRVDASTVRRWLIEARRALLEGTRSSLAQRLKLETGELDSLVAVLVTQLDESVRRILAEHAPRS
ncbi:MAG: sigma-70 family RNA polymerase sigma factor [Myxococcales bacterium]|jgi:RNA polymerase sigma-70 factor (ECF subfamily)